MKYVQYLIQTTLSLNNIGSICIHPYKMPLIAIWIMRVSDFLTIQPSDYAHEKRKCWSQLRIDTSGRGVNCGGLFNKLCIDCSLRVYHILYIIR